MKPPRFWYHRPDDREEVDRLLAEHGSNARILAGGQSLVPILNMRLASPARLVDINGLTGEPDEPEIDDGMVVLGPLVRMAAAEQSETVRRAVPLLAEALRYVAHPAIRNRGTVAGSIAHADPAAELPAVLLLLGGEVRARSARGHRTIAAADLFAGPFETSLAEDEWIDQVRFPAAGGSGYAFEEFSRRSGDFALCGVAAGAGPGTGAGPAVSLAYLGMGSAPVRFDLPPVPSGEAGSKALDEAIAATIQDALEPYEDIHATAEYRMHLARRLGARAARRAIRAMPAGGEDER